MPSSIPCAYLGVQAVAMLLHGQLLVHALDPRLTITHVGLKAPDPLLDLPARSYEAGRHHLKLQLRHPLQVGHSKAGLSKVSQTFLFCWWFFFCILILFPLNSSFILGDVFINLTRCSSTKFPESTDPFPFRIYFCELLTSLFNKRQRKVTIGLQWEGENYI